MAVNKSVKRTVNGFFKRKGLNEEVATYNPTVENGEPDYEAIKKACVDKTPNIRQSVEKALRGEKESFKDACLNLNSFQNQEIKDSEPLENLIIMCGLAQEDLENERVDVILDGLYQVLRNFAEDLVQVLKNVDNEDEENENLRQVEREKQQMYEQPNSKNVAAVNEFQKEKQITGKSPDTEIHAEDEDEEEVLESNDENTWGNDENTWGNDERMYQEVYNNSYEDKKEKKKADRLYNKGGGKKARTSKMERKTAKKINEVLNLVNEIYEDRKNSLIVNESKEKDTVFEKYMDKKLEKAKKYVDDLHEEFKGEVNEPSAYNMANVPAQRYLNQVQNYNREYEEKYMDERIPEIEDTQETEQDQAYQAKKREIEDDDEEYIQTTRGRDTLDFDYDSEPPQEWKDRVQREVETGHSREKSEEELNSEANIGGKDPYGSDGTRSDVGKEKYQNAQKRKEIDDNKPMYNKDQTPAQSEEDYEEAKKQYRQKGTGINESLNRFYSILNYNDSKTFASSNKVNANEDFKNKLHEHKSLFEKQNKKEIKEAKKAAKNLDITLDKQNKKVYSGNDVIAEGFRFNNLINEAEKIEDDIKYNISLEEAVAYKLRG
jgi:hypothetical protein